MKANIRDYALLLSLIAIMIFFQFTTNGILFTPLNMTNIILQNSYIVIMALGMLLIIVAGHIDLSVGFLSGFIGAHCRRADGQQSALAGGMAHGHRPGNHHLHCRRHRDWRIARLVRRQLPHPGLHRHAGRHADLSRSDDCHAVGPQSRPVPGILPGLSNGYVPDFLGLHGAGRDQPVCACCRRCGHSHHPLVQLAARASWKQEHGMAEEPIELFYGRNVIIAVAFLGFSWIMANHKGLPNVLVTMFALVALFMFITTRTTFGRRVYAMGGNEKAAQLSGINTERLTIAIFAIMGALSALAGLVYAARLNSAQPKAGSGLELDVIAACFIGGAAVTGGVGKITGVVIGAFIMGVMNNGMGIMGVGIDWQQVIKGAGADARRVPRRLLQEQGLRGGA